MTKPPERITVECPTCGTYYETWHRRSINLSLGETWTAEELREASTGTCPACAHVVELDSLVVEDGVWTFGRGDVRPPLDLDSNDAGRDWIKRGGREHGSCP